MSPMKDLMPEHMFDSFNYHAVRFRHLIKLFIDICILLYIYIIYICILLYIYICVCVT